MKPRKITQKDMVMRYLFQKMPSWVPAHELVRNASGSDYIIQDADTRAYDVLREQNEGYPYETEKAVYIIEHRKDGKYAEFRVAERLAKDGLMPISSKMAPQSDVTPKDDKYPVSQLNLLKT